MEDTGDNQKQSENVRFLFIVFLTGFLSGIQRVSGVLRWSKGLYRKRWFSLRLFYGGVLGIFRPKTTFRLLCY